MARTVDRPARRRPGTGRVRTPIEEALAVLEPALGPPSRIATWFFDHHYYWENLSLAVHFDSYPFFREDGVEHLVAWEHLDGVVAQLQTERGIGLGASFDELVGAHGDQVEVPASKSGVCEPRWYAWLNDPSPAARMMVALDAAPDEGGRIRHVEAGASKGC